uniref:Uncharacterized protein n=1 Tax=Arundo donax TaxID=35708 RepID=A0A0A9BZY6_ARUDO
MRKANLQTCHRCQNYLWCISQFVKLFFVNYECDFF